MSTFTQLDKIVLAILHCDKWISKNWMSHKAASEGEIPVLEFLGMLSTPSLPLLPGSLWPGVVIPVWVPSIGQIELFNHFLYLKPFNRVQTNVKLNY